jgi:two-component system, chemotaxis family, chemotaxis protein CheY
VLTGKIVLLAEDDSFMLDFISGVLYRDLNCKNVIICKNGGQALFILGSPEKRRGIQLILCDWMMPKANGDEVLKFVRQDEEISHIPFIMTTARSDKESLVKAIKLGISAYMVKPFSVADLVEKVTTVMKPKSKEDATAQSKQYNIDSALATTLTFGDKVPPYEGTLFEISLDKCLVRAPLFKHGINGLYDPVSLQIKHVNQTITLKAEIWGITPENQEPPSKTFMMVNLKVLEIEDAQKEILTKLLNS